MSCYNYLYKRSIQILRPLNPLEGGFNQLRRGWKSNVECCWSEVLSLLAVYKDSHT